MNDLLMEELIDIYKNPKNYGALKGKNVKSLTTANPICGDVVSLSVKIENKKIQDVKFKGEGCLISQVYSSLLTEKIKGKKTQEINKLEKDDILKLTEMKISPSRLKCALLCFEALRKIAEDK